MIGFKKRDTKTLIKAIARVKGVSVSEIRAEMQETIEEAKNGVESEVQINFKRYFGNKIPTPEEYIYTITKKTKDF